MGTGSQATPRRQEDRPPRWDRTRRAERFAQYRDLHAQGRSRRQAAKALEVPRRTLQAWRADQDRLDDQPAGVAFCHRAPGLACLHRLVRGLPLVGTAVGACGMRLGCRLGQRTGRDRVVAASAGAPHHVTRQVEEAIVASRREERARLAQDLPAKALPLAQEETCTGGLGLVAMDPKSHAMMLAPAAPARDHDPGPALMAQARSGLHGHLMPATSAEAPALLAEGAQPLGAPHAPALCQVQHALRTAVSAPMAATHRAAAQGVATAAARRTRVPEHRDNPKDTPEKRGPGRLPKGGASLEQVEQARAAARHAPHRRAAQRAPVTQRLRAMGPASHVVDLERGGRRNGTRIAGASRRPIDTIRTMAQQAPRSEPCLERLEKAARVGPKMPATSEVVAGEVRQQVRRLEVPSPPAYALPAQLMPSSYLERVASTRTVTAGEPLRELAERLRPPLCAPGGTRRALPPAAPDRLKQAAAPLAAVLQRSSANVAGRNGDLARSNHPRRGLDHPRTRAGLTAGHHFFLTRPDGTTAAERCFGQQPRAICAAILGAGDLPPAPLSPPHRAVGEARRP